ncbi:MAG: VCBS repeat-containing protein, partial [Bacteroidia bacterium]|nr:VCBS repeat-containing protein [Bacteroidia bacterium]
DALSDIVSLDMLPEDNLRKKTSFSFMDYERYQAERSMGYEPEFMRNMLQLNNGNYSSEDTSIPFFSEIGQLAGIYQTDWSWSILLADFNNDGWKDMHVTNGIGRDFINADFLEFSNEIFNSTQTREEQEKLIRKKLSSLNHVNLSNYLYMNQGGFTFIDSSAAAGINEPSMSNGAAYADLDNDGDLDLVINNINKEAFVFINNTNQRGKPVSVHSLSVKLQGTNLNTKGFGAKVFVYKNGNRQLQEQYPVRGYFSSVDQQLIFGMGKYDNADSIVVLWPDNKKQLLTNVLADTSVIFSWKNATDFDYNTPANSPVLFSDITASSGIGYRHFESSFNDYAVQRLLPQKYSQLGPFITTADVNNDGNEEFFVGGAFNFSGKIFTQQKGQTFSSKNITDSIKMEEDMGSIFFDADKDGDMDLLITSGDVQYEENSDYYHPRLYLNDGKGNFTLKKDAIPSSVKTIAGCVTAGDFDNDGDLDIFIGGRVSKTYPTPPKSYLLQNNNGIFSDVTEKVCPELIAPGMVTGAVWTDIDNDKLPDLVIAGEWMPVRFFKNDHGFLKEVTEQTGLTETNGMWRSLIATDIDNDGDMDLVAGNLGLNNMYNV